MIKEPTRGRIFFCRGTVYSQLREAVYPFDVMCGAVYSQLCEAVYPLDVMYDTVYSQLREAVYPLHVVGGRRLSVPDERVVAAQAVGRRAGPASVASRHRLRPHHGCCRRQCHAQRWRLLGHTPHRRHTDADRATSSPTVRPPASTAEYSPVPRHPRCRRRRRRRQSTERVRQ